MSVQEHLEEIRGHFASAHTSGHIYVNDIVEFVNGIGAKTVIPIHTFESEDFIRLFTSSHLLQDGKSFNVGEKS